MTKEELKALGLDDAAADKVATASIAELKNYVAKTKFDEVNESKKNLESQVADRDQQLETLKKSTGDVETLKNQISELQETNKTAKTDYESKIKQMRIDYAVDAALNGAKAKNLTAVKALIDLKDADIDDDGKIKGLDKQLKKLTEGEDTKFLFDSESSNVAGHDKPKTNLFGMNPVNTDKQTAGGSEKSIGEMFAANYNSIVAPQSGGTAQN